MLIFQYLLWSSCSVYSLFVPTVRMVSLLIQICNSLRALYITNELATVAEVFKEIAQQEMEGCSGFVFSEGLWQHFLWVLCLLLLECFRHCFQGWYLSNLWIFCKNRLVSQTRPFSFALQHQPHSGYEYCKQSALRNRNGPACETKPTVCKHEQK